MLWYENKTKKNQLYWFIKRFINCIYNDCLRVLGPTRVSICSIRRQLCSECKSAISPWSAVCNLAAAPSQDRLQANFNFVRPRRRSKPADRSVADCDAAAGGAWTQTAPFQVPRDVREQIHDLHQRFWTVQIEGRLRYYRRSQWTNGFTQSGSSQYSLSLFFKRFSGTNWNQNLKTKIYCNFHIVKLKSWNRKFEMMKKGRVWADLEWRLRNFFSPFWRSLWLYS